MKMEGKTILIFGDSIMGSDRYDGETEETKGVPDLIKDLSGATVINAGMPGSQYTLRADNKKNKFDGINLIRKLTFQGRTLENLSDSEKKDRFKELYELSKEVDETGQNIHVSGTRRGIENLHKWFCGEYFEPSKDYDPDKIDLIILAYGTNDWFEGSFLDDKRITSSYGVVFDVMGVISTIGQMIQYIQKTYPYTEILILTPIWRTFRNGQNSDTYNKVKDKKTLKEWSEKIIEVAKNNKIAVLDSYNNLQVSLNNKQYLYDKKNDNGTEYIDGTHLNYNGNVKYARLITGKIYSMFGV